jgi:diguanylate cyclase (GGDEF)-like protein
MAHGDEDASALVEATRGRLAAAALDDETAALLAEVLERYDRLAGEMQRLTRITDRIMSSEHVDRATGAYSRPHFVELIGHELARAGRFGRPFSILAIDVDEFAAINEKHGRAAGDAVLLALAAAGLGVLRRIDSLGRLGDSEFGALLPETDTTGATVLAARLREAVASMGVALGRESIEFTVSIGVVTWWGPAATVDEMLQKAKDALGAARGARGNKVGIAT